MISSAGVLASEYADHLPGRAVYACDMRACMRVWINNKIKISRPQQYHSLTMKVCVFVCGRAGAGSGTATYAKWMRGSTSDNENARRGSDDPKGLAS